MHRIERLVIYVALAIALLAAFGRTPPVGADGAADGKFGVVTATEVAHRGDGRDGARDDRRQRDGRHRRVEHEGREAGRGPRDLGERRVRGLPRRRRKDRLRGTATDARSACLSVSEAGGSRRAVVVGSDAGAANFYNADGKMVAYFGAASDTKAGLLFLLGGTGTSRVVEAGSSAGGGYLATNNVDAKQSTFLGTLSDTKAGTVQVNRADGTRGASLAP